MTLPFSKSAFGSARADGRDFWSYGIAANRKTLESFLITTMRKGCRRAW